MTDEKMAEEYCNKLYAEKVKNEDYDEYGRLLYRSKEIRDAFLAGLKAGRPKWHKVADGDLPNDDRIVSDQDGNNVRYVKHRNKWFYRHRTCEADVIAWCEKPQYTEQF